MASDRMSDKRLIPPVSTPYLTVILDRRPVQKVHTKLAHAKLAFDQFEGGGLYPGRWGKIYEQKDGEWVLLYDIPEPIAVEEPNPYYDEERWLSVKEEYRRPTATFAPTRIRYPDTRPWKQTGA